MLCQAFTTKEVGTHTVTFIHTHTYTHTYTHTNTHIQTSCRAFITKEVGRLPIVPSVPTLCNIHTPINYHTPSIILWSDIEQRSITSKYFHERNLRWHAVVVGINALFVGSAARVAWLLPFTTIYLGVYEICKRRYHPIHPNSHPLIIPFPFLSSQLPSYHPKSKPPLLSSFYTCTQLRSYHRLYMHQFNHLTHGPTVYN